MVYDWDIHRGLSLKKNSKALLAYKVAVDEMKSEQRDIAARHLAGGGIPTIMK